ncbi:MAG: hypothetical protein Q4F15_06150 [Bacillota bacterium]|nr:hypothetical protein [Bacillota bacterium]
MVVSEFGDFVNANLVWIIILGVALLLFIAALIVFRIRVGAGKPKWKKKKKEEIPLPSVDKSEYLLALGGEDNILSKQLTGSRISVKLADMEKADPEKLLQAGVSSYIKMSDRLILVIKAHAEEVYNSIFGG